MNKHDLRQQINQKRRMLPLGFQQKASHSICTTLKKHPAIKSASTIAIYYAIQGEANPFPLTQELAKRWLLPVVSSEKMQFVSFTQGNDLIKNSYGILEPVDKTKVIATSTIDIILLPLVSFDSEGNRIGRGAGHYDRALAFMQQHATEKRPYLIGISYEFQRTEKIKGESWDIPLDEIITEEKTYP